MIKTKSKIMSQDKEITNTLKKNIFPNPTHLPVHCNWKRREEKEDEEEDEKLRGEKRREEE